MSEDTRMALDLHEGRCARPGGEMGTTTPPKWVMWFVAHGATVNASGVKPTYLTKTTMMNFTRIALGALGTSLALAVGIVTTAPKAHAGGVYVNGNGGGAVVRTAPHTTTVKHNTNKDTVKVCREYNYGTKNCAKWTY